MRALPKPRVLRANRLRVGACASDSRLRRLQRLVSLRHRLHQRSSGVLVSGDGRVGLKDGCDSLLVKPRGGCNLRLSRFKFFARLVVLHSRRVARGSALGKTRLCLGVGARGVGASPLGGRSSVRLARELAIRFVNLVASLRE